MKDKLDQNLTNTNVDPDEEATKAVSGSSDTDVGSTSDDTSDSASGSASEAETDTNTEDTVQETTEDDSVTETTDDDSKDSAKNDEEGVIVINSNVHPDARWYVVHTYSGHENKVSVTLKQRAEAGGYTDRIFKLYVPQQQKIVVTEGRKRSVEEKLYPGYLMAQMLMDDDTWYVVRSTPGVTGFVGMGSTPTPLSNSEVKELMRFTKIEAPKFEAKFKVGDSIKINEGPFRDFLGKVDEVNDEQGKVKVLVSVFGRETPVELDFAQVNRI